MNATPLVTALNVDGPYEIRDSVSSSVVLSATIAMAGSLVVGSIVGFTHAPLVADSSRTIRGLSEWTTSRWSGHPGLAMRAEPAKPLGRPVRSSAEAIGVLRSISGLTWDQISKLFGVSRRSVHLWASGRPMNAGHEEALFRLLAVVEALPARSAGERRAGLLMPREGGRSLYDELRAEKTSWVRIGGSPFSYDKLVGAPE
jgi:DNA-binding transcriptional regulator YiaG